MITRRTRPIRRAAQHIALIEAAVADHANALWDRALIYRLRWLRFVLTRLRPSLERLIQERTQGPEVILLETIIRQTAQDYPVPNLTGSLAELGRSISLQYGFLPSDPRAQALEQSFKTMLEADAFRYWQGLTDPAELAKKLAGYRERGQTTAQIIRQVQTDYRAGYFSAERMVRTLYNSGANAAQIEALRAQGYTHKKWLTARDSRVRSPSRGSKYNHRAMDGVMVPLEQPFITPTGSRMITPGDRSQGAPPGDWINCRCTVQGLIFDIQPSRDNFNIPALPARPRAQTWAPVGRSMQDFLRFPRRAAQESDSQVFALVEEAARITSRVHGVDGLPQIPVVRRLLNPDELARYAPNPKTGDPAYIGVEPGKTDLLAILEEFGHFIDHQAFTKNVYASVQTSKGPLANWWDIVSETTAVKELRSLRRAFYTYDDLGQKAVDRAFVAYLLYPEELFARSYRQFVAVNSGDEHLLAAIGSRQNKPGSKIGYNIQWLDDEFEAIALELEKIFRRLGWLKLR